MIILERVDWTKVKAGGQGVIRLPFVSKYGFKPILYGDSKDSAIMVVNPKTLTIISMNLSVIDTQKKSKIIIELKPNIKWKKGDELLLVVTTAIEDRHGSRPTAPTYSLHQIL